jgi:hypothetical protein
MRSIRALPRPTSARSAKDQKVRFTVDAFPNRSFQGEVQQIRLNPTTQQNVVTYNVRVSPSNPEHILLPGMTAYVSIVVASRQDVLLVPNAALRFKPARNGNRAGDGAAGQPAGMRRRPGEGKRSKREASASGTVYRVENGELKPVSVQLGITDNRNTEVLGGELKAGDRSSSARTVAADNGKPSSVGCGCSDARAVIRVVGLGKSYDTAAGLFPALRDVDLSIAPGEFVAIMGPSGLGQVDLHEPAWLPRPPSSGDYFLVGRNVAHLDKDELARCATAPSASSSRASTCCRA